MKEIRAYIKTHKLPDVTSALRAIAGLTGMTVLECHGFGAGWGATEANRGSDALDSRKGVKVEICCREDLAEEVVAAIRNAAHTGLKGDGKIYVADITHAVRISTGEKGESAV